jgi:hypothetical protein
MIVRESEGLGRTAFAARNYNTGDIIHGIHNAFRSSRACFCVNSIEERPILTWRRRGKCGGIVNVATAYHNADATTQATIMKDFYVPSRGQQQNGMLCDHCTSTNVVIQPLLLFVS